MHDPVAISFVQFDGGDRTPSRPRKQPSRVRAAPLGLAGGQRLLVLRHHLWRGVRSSGGRREAVGFDIRPVFKGHVRWLRETTYGRTRTCPKRFSPFFSTGQQVAAAMTSVLGAEGSFVAMNNVVSQSVPHLHLHVVPRTKGDGLRGFFWPRTRYAGQSDQLRTPARRPRCRSEGRDLVRARPRVIQIRRRSSPPPRELPPAVPAAVSCRGTYGPRPAARPRPTHEPARAPVLEHSRGERSVLHQPEEARWSGSRNRSRLMS